MDIFGDLESFFSSMDNSIKYFHVLKLTVIHETTIDVINETENFSATNERYVKTGCK